MERKSEVYKQIMAIREGLPVQDLDRVATTFGLSREAFAQSLGIDTRSLMGRSRSGRLTSIQSEKVARAQRIHKAALALFSTGEAAALWLRTSNAALDSVAPVDLLDTDVGSRAVEDLLLALRHGMFV